MSTRLYPVRESEAALTVQQETWETQNRATLEKQLAELHGQIRVNQIEAGRIISDLRKSFKHGEWMPYSQKLFLRLKLSRKTAERYVDAFQKAKDIGEPIIQGAEAGGLNLNRIPVREALLEVKHQHPNASPSKIVNLTNLKLQGDDAKKKNTPRPTSCCKAADFVVPITTLRSKFSELNQLTKQIQNGTTNQSEAETLVAALRALSEDARQRADRITEALNSARQEKAA